MIGQPQVRPFIDSQSSYLSVGLDSLIVALWLLTLVVAFTVDISATPWVIVLAGVLIRAFFHTGLFIVTHEAIHGNIARSNWLNDGFGYLTSFLYALLPYRKLASNHQLHHRFPGTEQDPDYCPSGKNNFLSWYFKFMKNYQADGQIWVSLTGMAAVFGIFIYLNISILNLALFWIVPMIISSLQLFTFGIFLPHRQLEGSSQNSHQIESIRFPVFWSLMTCYHFGYHWEHHQYPNLPWYQLPQACSKR